MAKKKVQKIIKLQIPAGKANPAPPIGPALGAAGVNIMGFCKEFNASTQKMIGDILKTLGYGKVGDKIERELFDTNKNKVINENRFFTNSTKSQMLFNYDKLFICKIQKNVIKTVKQFLGFINSVFKDWGIVIKAERKYVHVKINNKRTTKCNSLYVLQFIDNMNKYL